MLMHTNKFHSKWSSDCRKKVPMSITITIVLVIDKSTVHYTHLPTITQGMDLGLHAQSMDPYLSG